jgi:predicted esterase
MQRPKRGSAVLGAIVGAGAVLMLAALHVGSIASAPLPRTAVAAPVAHDGASAAGLPRPALEPPASADASSVASALPSDASASRSAAQPPAAPAPSPAQDLVFDDYYVHVPPGVASPAPVLVALHGMGGDGRRMCDTVRAWSDQEGWVLVGPTFAYGDWTDPGAVASEGPRFLPRLAQILDELPATIGNPVQPRIALYGFSRGAQLAARFAMLYPDRVRGAVVMSGGTYTLPLRDTTVSGSVQPLPYPFGVADVRQRFGRDADLDALRGVPFWIGVGADDNDPTAVPAQWSPYIGNTRVERARRLAEALRSLQVPVQETEFPGLGHDIGNAEHDQALAWVRSLP